MSEIWTELFGNARAVEVEVGAGTGTFVLPTAMANPDVNYFAIEHSTSRARRLEAVAREWKLANVVVLQADAGCVINTVVPTASVQAYHIYFPDPWWKRRHHRRRLFTPAFAANLARTLTTGGRLYVATDVAQVFEQISSIVSKSDAWIIDPTVRSPRTQRTLFEHKGLRRGATIHEVVYVRVNDAPASRAQSVAS